jgi:hypothetical protein
MTNLWLDDIRPAPFGYKHAKTVEEAQTILRTEPVQSASLDHDLGACKSCWSGTPEEWLTYHSCQSMPNCEHFGTGYTLVKWMEETDIWPEEMPKVHSRNAYGRQRMEAVIRNKFTEGNGSPKGTEGK